MENTIQIYFTGRMSVMMIIEKCNQCKRNGKYRYKTIEFCNIDDFRCAATVKMRRDGYEIQLEELGLLSR